MITRYFIVNLLPVIILVWGCLLGLSFVFRLIDAIDDAPFVEALINTLLHLPRKGAETLPLATIIGAAIGFRLISERREFFALLSAGLSLRALVRKLFSLSLLIIAVSLFVTEVLMGYFEKQLIRTQDRATPAFTVANYLWVLDGDDYVRIGQINPETQQLYDVTIYRVRDGELIGVTTARQADYRQDDWLLLDGQDMLLQQGQPVMQPFQSKKWTTTLNRRIVNAMTLRPKSMTLQQLHHTGRYLKSNQQDSSIYDAYFWQKLSALLQIPLLFILGICFVSVEKRYGIMQAMLVSFSIYAMIFLANKLAYFVALEFIAIPFFIFIINLSLLLLFVRFALRRQAITATEYGKK